MKSCKEISKLVSESMERKLKLSESIELRLHLVMCRICCLFRSNLRAIQSVTKSLGSEFTPPSPLLSSSAKERIAAAIKDAQSDENG